MIGSKTKILLISASGKTGGGPSHIFLLKKILKDEFDFYLAMPKVGNLSKGFDRRKYLEIAERKIIVQDIMRLVLFSKNSNFLLSDISIQISNAFFIKLRLDGSAQIPKLLLRIISATSPLIIPSMGFLAAI